LAKAAWNKAYDIAPSPHFKNGSAAASRHLGDFELAERLYSEVRADYPESVAAIVGLAAVRRDERCLDEAYRLYHEVLTRNCNYIHTLNGLGAVCVDMGRREEAEDCFRRTEVISGEQDHAAAMRDTFAGVHALRNAYSDYGDTVGVARLDDVFARLQSRLGRRP